MSERKIVEKIVEIYEDSLDDFGRELPDLVRCKDCFYNTDNEEMPFACSIREIFANGNDNWFCGKGIRK